MIDQADRGLQEWIKSVLPEIDVVLAPPQQLTGKYGISLYLLSLVRPPTIWLNRHPTPQVALRYLITTWAADETEAHRLLGNLISAILENRAYELDLEELPATLWTALGIAPRPSCVLIAPLAFERAEPVPSLVRAPLVVHSVPVKSLGGVVLGPGNLPVVGAQVELPALALQSQTDAHGRFSFSTVPAEPHRLQLLVKARGQTKSVLFEQPASDKETLAIHFDFFSTK